MDCFQHLRLTRPLIVFDTETTGRDPGGDRLVELAAVRFDPDAESDSYHARINPGVPIPAAATAVHGITDADVAGCPAFTDVAQELIQFLGGCDLAGFNVKGFDLPFLIAEFRRCGRELELRGRAVLDAMQVYHERERRDLSAAIRFYCEKEHGTAHTALGDALAAAEVLDAQLECYDDLPRDPRALHRHFCPVDLAGKFRLEESRVAFAFGKHAGRWVAEIARDDPGYMKWLLRQNLLPDARRIAVEAPRRFAPAG